MARQPAEKAQVWGGRLNTPPDKMNIAFCSGRDVASVPMADELLLKYDIWTNLAHVKMLNRCGILKDDECRELCDALVALDTKVRQGDFHLDPRKEDVHINIEHHITHTLGIEAGKKIHTGRSRNDQSGTDIKLYLRDQLLETSENVKTLIEAILEKAAPELKSIMPGFTHYQPAMLTTAAHWLTSWSQALLRDLERLVQDLEMLNRSPLGAAAAFGTSWAIDREYAAQLLGFDAPDENSLDCISARGEYEARAAATLSFLMNHLGTIAQDMILLSMPYYGMLVIPDQYVTGSSIMPQKKNPDFAELIRGKAACCHGALASLLGIQKGSMSGYNREYQLSKYVIMDVFRECRDAPSILSAVINAMTFNRAEMLAKAQKGFMNSVDVADLLARKFNLAFRDCYELLSLAVKNCEAAGQLTKQGLEKAIDHLGLPVKLSKRDIRLFNSPYLLLQEKEHTGAPSVASVKRMTVLQAHALQKVAKKIRAFHNRVRSAQKECFRRQ
ncbi:MAG: argininosuccinate lyase [Deltaproteobacteria bacterium]|nr:argininosuccinate lyase [Deltaproteobacteria bacterium]